MISAPTAPRERSDPLWVRSAGVVVNAQSVPRRRRSTRRSRGRSHKTGLRSSYRYAQNSRPSNSLPRHVRCAGQHPESRRHAEPGAHVFRVVARTPGNARSRRILTHDPEPSPHRRVRAQPARRQHGPARRSHRQDDGQRPGARQQLPQRPELPPARSSRTVTIGWLPMRPDDWRVQSPCSTSPWIKIAKVPWSPCRVGG